MPSRGVKQRAPRGQWTVAASRAIGEPMARTVGEYTTPLAHWLGPDDSVEAAQSLMQANAIRHLPVLEGGRARGIVTLSDLHTVGTLLGVDAETTRVRDVMSTELYAVQRGEPLAAVAREMASRRIGSCIVQDGDRVAGIFTATDALRALADALGG